MWTLPFLGVGMGHGHGCHWSLGLVGEDDLEAMKAKNIKQTELVADLPALGPRGRWACCPKNNIHERLWPSDLLWLSESPPHPPTNHLSTRRPEAETWTKVAQGKSF